MSRQYWQDVSNYKEDHDGGISDTDFFKCNREEDFAMRITTEHFSVWPVVPTEKLGEIFKYLSSTPLQEVPTAAEQAPATEFPACSPPDVRTPPHFVIPYRRPLIKSRLDWYLEEFASIQLGCAKVVNVEDLQVYFVDDYRYEQSWNLMKVGIGDLASTMSLAPSEQLTLEFLSSQRKVLEQTTLDSTEELDSTESTTMDKEVVNVVRSATKTQNWRVDGSGALSLGKWLGIQVSGGASGSNTQSVQNSIQHITEATKKSAHSLKTLHKIEVRGVTEGLIQNRMTRVIKNPYLDRTLSVNVFQLIKHFSVKTTLVEVRSALSIQVDKIIFDNDFVVANANFLRDSLLDQSLIDELPEAIEGAKPMPPTDIIQSALTTAKDAFHFLYVEPNIFDLPSETPDENDPTSSFHAKETGSGYDDALEQGPETIIIFTILNFFWKVYQKKLSDNVLDADAIALAVTLADSVSTMWSTFQSNADALNKLLDSEDLTEIFRRLSGFLAMVNGMLKPLVPSSALQEAAVKEHEKGGFVLKRLLAHLNCHKNYYIQQFLLYTARKTNNQDIVDFVTQVISAVIKASGAQLSKIFELYDVQRSYIDRQEIVVPAFQALEDYQIIRMNAYLSTATASYEFSRDQIKPSVVEIEVPTDGIHLEAAAGACVLRQLPAQAEKSVEFTIHDASLKASG